jgi:hypothetical protein
MNNQQVKGFWKITEDFPSREGPYLVAFPDRSGNYRILDCDVWQFSNGEWLSLGDSRFVEEVVGLPSYYLDLPMPK